MHCAQFTRFTKARHSGCHKTRRYKVRIRRVAIVFCNLAVRMLVGIAYERIGFSTSGISSFIFTKWGEGLYLHSSSEIQRITLSASRKIVPRCALKSNANNDSKQTFAFLKEKPNSVLNNSNVIGEIPEEDEEQQEETEPRNNRNKKGKLISRLN